MTEPTNDPRYTTAQPPRTEQPVPAGRYPEPDARERTTPESERPMESAGQPANQPANQGGVAWHEAEGYRTRFNQVQAEFIDNPKAAVEHAGQLVKEAIDRMMESTRQDAGDGNDTERMRLTLQRYRNLLEAVAGSR